MDTSYAVAVVLGTLIMCAWANAKEKSQGPTYHANGKQVTTYHANGKQVTRVEALYALVREPGARVVRCVELTLSDKGTLKTMPKK